MSRENIRRRKKFAFDKRIYSRYFQKYQEIFHEGNYFQNTQFTTMKGEEEMKELLLIEIPGRFLRKFQLFSTVFTKVK